jgi:hypothetical protein
MREDARPVAPPPRSPAVLPTSPRRTTPASSASAASLHTSSRRAVARADAMSRADAKCRALSVLLGPLGSGPGALIIVNIFLGGKSREFAFPKIVQRIVHRVGKRARAAPTTRLQNKRNTQLQSLAMPIYPYPYWEPQSTSGLW